MLSLSEIGFKQIYFCLTLPVIINSVRLLFFGKQNNNVISGTQSNYKKKKKPPVPQSAFLSSLEGASS